MIRYKTLCNIFFIILFYSCEEELKYIETNYNTLNQNDSILKTDKYWHFKDIERDTIPGLSFNRAYSKFLKLI